MAFDLFRQNFTQGENNGLSFDDYLNFKPTLNDGTLLKDNGTKPFTPQEITQSAKTHMPITRNGFNSPFSLGSNLSNALTFNGIDINDAKSAVELDNPEMMSNGKKSRFENMMDYISHNVQPPKQELYKEAKAYEGNFRSTKLNNMNQNLTRYEMSGKDINKIPFNPFTNNEKLYQERMSSWQDAKRAFGGLLMTAKLGLTDSLAIGTSIDTDAASIFEAANKLGGSSKDGLVGEVNNLMISAGYTIGILGEIGLEGALMLGVEGLAGITAPVTGGTSIAAGIGAGTVMAADISKKGSALLKAVKSLSKSQTWKNMGKSALSAINPLDDVMKFRKSTEVGGAMSGASKIQKAVGYSTSAWRGYNKIKFAYEEAAMEAGTTFMETKDQAINEFYAENGRMPSFEEIDKIMDLSKAVSYNTFMWNLPTIYLSNAFVFDDLLRPKKFSFSKGIGKAAASKNEVLFSRGVVNGKKMWQATKTPADFWGKVSLGLSNKKLGYQMLRQASKEYVAENTVEGLQEVVQDLFQNASKAQFYDLYNGNEINGSYYNYLLANKESIFSAQGLEAFMSGFLMQMMVSPIAKFSARLAGNKNALKNGFLTSTLSKPAEFIGDKVRGLTNKDVKAAGGIDKYKEQQKQKEKELWEKEHPGEEYVDSEQELDKQVELLNDFFKDPVKYANPVFHRAMQNRNYDEYRTMLASDGNKLGFIDTVKEQEFNNIMTILNYGGFEKFNEAMDDLVMNTTKEEFDKNNYGITYEDYLNNVELTRQYAKDLQTKKDNIDQIFENPFHLEYYRGKEDTPEYEEAARGWVAYEAAKRDILFQQMQVEDAIGRAQSMTEKLGKIFSTSAIPFQEIKVLLSNSNTNSRNDMLDKLATLEQEIKAMDKGFADTTDPEMKKQYEYKKKVFESLLKIRKMVADESTNALTGKEDLTALKEEVKNYLNLIAGNYGAPSFGGVEAITNLDNIVKMMIDTKNLSERAQVASWSVNMLLDPKGFAQSYENHKKWIDDVHSHRKEEIKKALKAFRDAMNYDEMMRKLHAIGVFFLPDDKDKLVNENKIPTLYQYLNNGEDFIDEVDITSETYQSAIDIIMSYFPNAKGAKIYGGEQQNRINNNRGDDTRTLNDILKEYDIDLSKGSITMNASDILDKIISGVHPGTTTRMSALAQALRSLIGDAKISFSKNMSSAIHFNSDDDTLIVDPRYASNEYENAFMNFEDLVLRAVLSKVLADKAKSDERFIAKIEPLRKETAEFIDKNKVAFPGLLQIQNISNPIEFVSKAFTDGVLAGVLNQVNTNEVTQRKDNTIWNAFTESLKSVFHNDSQTVLNAIQDVLSDVFYQEPIVQREEIKPEVTPEELKENNPEQYEELLKKGKKENQVEQEEPETANENQEVKPEEQIVQEQLNKADEDPQVMEILQPEQNEKNDSIRDIRNNFKNAKDSIGQKDSPYVKEYIATVNNMIASGSFNFNIERDRPYKIMCLRFFDESFGIKPVTDMPIFAVKVFELFDSDVFGDKECDVDNVISELEKIGLDRATFGNVFEFVEKLRPEGKSDNNEIEQVFDLLTNGTVDINNTEFYCEVSYENGEKIISLTDDKDKQPMRLNKEGFVQFFNATGNSSINMETDPEVIDTLPDEEADGLVDDANNNIDDVELINEDEYTNESESDYITVAATENNEKFIIKFFDDDIHSILLNEEAKEMFTELMNMGGIELLAYNENGELEEMFDFPNEAIEYLSRNPDSVFSLYRNGIIENGDIKRPTQYILEDLKC